MFLSFGRRIFAIILLILIFPFLLFFSIIIKLGSKGPVLFTQKRMGKHKKVFTMYKFRTMREHAEKLKKNYLKLNEAKEGPVFKIYNDPRFTNMGKILSHTGLDEIPQLLNVLKGDMAFVGPRPLPVEEAQKIPQKYSQRFSVLPGITSLWIIRGAHFLTFTQWMDLDMKYVKKKSVVYDLLILIQTMVLLLKLIFLKQHNRKQLKS